MAVNIGAEDSFIATSNSTTLEINGAGSIFVDPRSDGRFGRKIKRSLSVEYELMKHIEWKAS